MPSYKILLEEVSPKSYPKLKGRVTKLPTATVVTTNTLKDAISRASTMCPGHRVVSIELPNGRKLTQTYDAS